MRKIQGSRNFRISFYSHPQSVHHYQYVALATPAFMAPGVTSSLLYNLESFIFCFQISFDLCEEIYSCLLTNCWKKKQLYEVVGYNYITDLLFFKIVQWGTDIWGLGGVFQGCKFVLCSYLKKTKKNQYSVNIEIHSTTPKLQTSTNLTKSKLLQTLKDQRNK